MSNIINSIVIQLIRLFWFRYSRNRYLFLSNKQAEILVKLKTNQSNKWDLVSREWNYFSILSKLSILYKIIIFKRQSINILLASLRKISPYLSVDVPYISISRVCSKLEMSTFYGFLEREKYIQLTASRK